MTDFHAMRLDLLRQIKHWIMAAERLAYLDTLAAPHSWSSLEGYLNVSLKDALHKSVEQLLSNAKRVERQLADARFLQDLQYVEKGLEQVRNQYFTTELVIEFYTDAVNSRTNPEIGSMLQACDILALRSMQALLNPLGKFTPPVLTYLNEGLGANILKAGLRLWDRKTYSPAAAIKITRHNLFLPTALIHETGHQAAHLTGWNQELANALLIGLRKTSLEVATTWSNWASEIAADTFAFAHTGYAAVASLQNVASGGKNWVFQYVDGDPHPIGYIRVLLGTAMCQHFYGDGPWNALAEIWKKRYPLSFADRDVARFLTQSEPLLPEIVKICLLQPMSGFDNQALVRYIHPKHVSPTALMALEKQGGAALFNSSHWVHSESIRLLALCGYKMAVYPERTKEIQQQQLQWMTRLGRSLQAA